MFLSKKNQVFKTVTGDNGSEFATLADFEKYGMSVYFTHPYTSCTEENSRIPHPRRAV